MTPQDLRLQATSRTERGKHVHLLRREGQVPAVLYGQKHEPLALVAEARSLERIWRQAGKSHLVDLVVDDKKPQKVLIREFQIEPRTQTPLHADFYVVDLKHKLTVDVPVHCVGESEVITVQKIGQLLQIVNTLKVECLPSDIPAQINVDISTLTELEAAVHVKDLELPHGVTVGPHIDPEEVVVKIVPVRVAAVEEEAAPAAEEAAAAPAPAGEEAKPEENA